jgi:hypothetical protein
MDNLFMGVKMILATSMNREDYNEKRGWEIPENEKGMEKDPGFLVEYIDGGKPNTDFSKNYVSWSPKEVFDKSYRKIENGEVSFSQAVELLKKGKAVSRKGWNGKNMFLYLVPADSYVPQTGVAKDVWKNKKVPYGAYIAMKTAQGNVVPWLASQTDLLSDDWGVVIPTK